jgi:hypothetical protein
MVFFRELEVTVRVSPVERVEVTAFEHSVPFSE